MTQSLQPYRGRYPTPAFEKTSVMRPGVSGLRPDAPLVTVARRIATHHVDSVVVACRPAAVISSLDIAGALAWGGRRR